MGACRRCVVVAALVAGWGCAGGGGSASWTAGSFEPSASLAARCANPRSGIDPGTGRAYADVRGSTTAENDWLRSWTHELYLWYREAPDLNPALYATTAAYFDLLKTSATTASGNPKDRFHFTYPTDEWIALSQSGVEAGYGVQWLVVSATPPRQVMAAYTEPGSPATAAAVGLARGARVLTVDGVDVANATDATSVNRLNEGLFPSQAGASHSFSILDRGAATPRNVTMVSANVTSTPVQRVGTIRTGSRTVGYMIFNDHIATAEPQLVSAFSQLAAANVDELVLDIRYNGGGYLDIASEVAYMIAGPGRTAGQPFERTLFNDKHPTRDPVTGDALAPIPFHTATQGFSGPRGQALPTLNLARVALLTGTGTCSASESIVNGLRGVGLPVIQIGSTTCGKPFGFYPADNCGTTYFSIQFQGVNAQGFGDYPDGFSPANTIVNPGVPVTGCSVADDLAHELGDPAEARLAAALAFLAGQNCPARAAIAAGPEAAEAAARGDGLVPKSPWHQNRILRR